jgi:undecaprenyl diphosphate synthase
VAALMKLLGRYLVEECDRCVADGVRIQAIGRRDRLAAPLVALLEEAERKTAGGRRLLLRIALDYSSRQAILDAARALTSSRAITEESLSHLLGPDVDLLIRTSGEQRLSDFLLWECAYAEMVFTRRMWPEFGEKDLAAAVEEFRGRERRFGAVAAEQRTA